MAIRILRRGGLIISLLSGLSMLVSCAVQQPQQHNDAAIQSAWVVLGEEGQAIARVVTTDNLCPQLVQDGTPQQMKVRAQPAILPPRAAANAADVKPVAFPVLTCEAVLKKDIKAAEVGGWRLPLPKAEPRKILVIGDTGCRIKQADNAFQSCNDAGQWPFQQVSNTAAAFKPDLVIHVGDYQYRETPCPRSDAGCANSPWGYGWDTWDADLFKPAAALLKAAPWVMARGNHETCQRAGQGWWRFLDPRPYEEGRDCNVPVNDSKGNYSDPYAVSLGNGAQLIVFDSSAVPWKPLPPDSDAYRVYLNEFGVVDRLANNAQFNFFISHHPALGYATEAGKDGKVIVSPSSTTLQQIMRNRHPQRLFPNNVQAALAGHVHLFQAIGFSSGQSAQFVSGNGGSLADLPLPAVLPESLSPYAPAKVSTFVTGRYYGFMTLERVGQQWKATSWDRDGKPMAKCELEDKTLRCEH